MSSAFHKNVRLILTGNLEQTIWKLSLPIMFSNLLQAVYNLVDTFWVARLGGYAIAALTVSYPIAFFFIAIGLGIDTGSSVLASHSVGKAYRKMEEYDSKVGRIFAQTILLFFSFYFILLISGLISLPYLVKLMGPEKLVFSNALAYSRVIIVGSIFLFLYYAVEASLRALGDTKTPMKLVTASVVLNVVLDPFFIFGIGMPKMGVMGAAIATILSRALVNVYAFFKLIKGDYGIKVKMKYFKPNKKIIEEILKLGIPSSFGMLSMSLGMFFFTMIVSYFGTDVIAAYGLVVRFFSLERIPAMGIAAALSIIVAQNYGAENISRMFEAVKSSIKIGLEIMIPLTLILFLFPKWIIEIFTREPHILSLASQFLTILSPFFLIMLFRSVLVGFFNGVKRTDISMFINMANSFLFKLPLAYLFAFTLHLGVLGVWWSYPAMMSFTLLLSIIFFVRQKKKIYKRAVEGSRTPV